MMIGNFEFKNPAHKQVVESDGYMVAPLLSPQQVKDLRAVFNRYFNIAELPAVFDTIATVQSETMRAVNKDILDICMPSLNQLFGNFKALGAIFFIKRPHDNSELGIHVDPSQTLEGYNNFGLWIPLNDIDESIGQMCLLKGSQRYAPSYHAAAMPCPYKDIYHLVKPRMDRISMNAGDVLFFTNNMAHCTLKNTSANDRIAIVIKMIDANAPLVTAYYNEGGNVKLYEHSLDFFLTDDFKQPAPPATSKFIKEVEGLPKIFTANEFLQLAEGAEAKV